MTPDLLLPLLLLLPLEETTEAPEPPSMLPLLVAIAAIFYFVMIMPERKKRKQREALLAELGKGDKVMMKSGLYGSIVQVQDETVTVQVADGVRLKFAREAIQNLIDESEPKDAEKSDDKKS